MNTIAPRFFAVAERHAERPAVCSGRDTTSYAELARRAHCVAAFLQARGIGRGHRVAIKMEKSADCFATMLGVLASGAAYIPLEATLRPELEARILAHANASAVFRTGGATRMPPGSVLEILDEQLAEIMATPPRSAILADVEAHETAYILYTSGSTGAPKGVELSHRAALAFVDWAAGHFALNPDDRISNHASLTFDLSVFDVFGALLYGAALYPVPEMQRGMPPYLARFMTDRAITVWYSVPSVACRIAEALSANAPVSRVRHLILAGEPFPKHAIPLLLRTFPNAKLCNLYGPTETNVVTFHDVSEVDAHSSQAVPIGRACPYAKTRVVDDSGAELAPGSRGMLLVACDSLMTGYWADPERTAASIERIGDERYYRTGDVVDQDASGVLRFVGRNDLMVKVEGTRIDLEDVEHVIAGAPGIQELAVLPWITRDLKKSLVSFVVSDTAPENVVEWCASRLPRAMIPKLIVRVDCLPRTDRGKVDRAALRSAVLLAETPSEVWRIDRVRSAFVRVLETLDATARRALERWTRAEDPGSIASDASITPTELVALVEQTRAALLATI